MHVKTRRSLVRRQLLIALSACGVAAASFASPGWAVFAAQGMRLVDTDLWLTPPAVIPTFGTAATALAEGRAAEALPVFSRTTSDPLLGGYARLYQGRAQLALNRAPEAMASARQVLNAAPGGYLGEQALWLLADAADKAGKPEEAKSALAALVAMPASNVALAQLRLGQVAFKSDEAMLAAQSYTKLYYDYPVTPEAAAAESEMKRYFHWPPANDTFELAEARAEQLFAARRYSDARKAFDPLLIRASATDKPRIRLRLAECDFYLKRYGDARTGLRTYLETATTRLDEAQYFLLSATRELRRDDEYVSMVRAFVDGNASSSYAEVALNDLATHYILANDDEKAVGVFREIVTKYPSGGVGDRAFWRTGWWAFRAGNYAETIRLFEAANSLYPRADYRPGWLYWTARAEERLGNHAAAATGYRATITAYRNSYYGRQAQRALDALPPTVAAPPAPARGVTVSGPGPRAARPSPMPSASSVALGGRRAGAPASPAPAPAAAPFVTPGGAPPNAPLIRALLSAGLYDDAIGELRRAQAASGTSPFLEATIAYALNRKGELRPGITAMRRAYPQFMADGGQAFPIDLLKVIFPLEYWDIIRQQAAARNLDPYLVAALVAQESTFQADVRSSANAWGLMQIVPATGRQYAAKLGIRRFTTASLTEPEINLRIGTAYLADLIARQGDVISALAAYNAGESRIARWHAERPGVDRDEFIDDIPFPETQNYVKRIIGTAEDYRILYPMPRTGGVRELRR